MFRNVSKLNKIELEAVILGGEESLNKIREQLIERFEGYNEKHEEAIISYKFTPKEGVTEEVFDLEKRQKK